MKVEILELAKNDLRRGFRFYERAQLGVGGYFVRTLTAEAQALEVTAGIHSKRGMLFRVKSKTFPHWIYYFLKENLVYVLAVIDARQAPSKIDQREKKMQSLF